MVFDLADNEAASADAKETLGTGIKPPPLGAGVMPRWCAQLRAGAANRRYTRAAVQIPQARGWPVISSPCAGRESKIWPCHLAFIVGGYYSKYWRRRCNSLYYRPE
jgi:hypothetical protein